MKDKKRMEKQSLIHLIYNSIERKKRDGKIYRSKKKNKKGITKSKGGLANYF